MSIDQLENIKFPNDHHKKMIPYKSCLRLNRWNYHKIFWSWINSVTKRMHCIARAKFLVISMYSENTKFYQFPFTLTSLCGRLCYNWCFTNDSMCLISFCFEPTELICLDGFTNLFSSHPSMTFRACQNNSCIKTWTQTESLSR